MSSLHDSAFAAWALPGQLDWYGESLIYTSPAGVSTTVTAIVSEEETVQEETPDGLTMTGVRRCSFTNDPASTYGGVATVEPGDQVTAGGNSFVVRTASGPAGGMWELVIVRRLLAEAARPGIRDVTGYRRRQ